MEQAIPTKTVRRDLAIPAAFFIDSLGAIYTAVERVIELNVQTLKTSLLEQRALAGAVFSPQSAAECIELPMRLLPATVKKQVAYWRHFGDIGFQAHNALVGLVRDYSDPASIASILSETNENRRAVPSLVILPDSAAGGDGLVARRGDDASRGVVINTLGDPATPAGSDDVQH
ncbi:phasin family protein [Paraburkholderia fungorum]|uniref:Phasin family protein n=1 Tax=Paraburkholderia fungorum TaxID=134537 RepID=A0A1H1JWA2_9BURK|nr:TIGR01841 family phasin [Paraburkholderia fungorum]SDR54019.1 phasin family protein [Paraburkholderia fungorum]